MHWHLGKILKRTATLSLSFLVWPWHATDLLPGRPSLETGGRCSCSLELPLAAFLASSSTHSLLVIPPYTRGPPELQLNPGMSAPDVHHLLMKRPHQVVAQCIATLQLRVGIQLI